MNKKEILKLAELARLNITDVEAEGYKKDFEGILAYIDSIKSVDIELADHYKTNLTQNTLRNDDDSYIAGEFSEVLLAEAPDTKGDYLKVKKVL